MWKYEYTGVYEYEQCTVYVCYVHILEVCVRTCILLYIFALVCLFINSFSYTYPLRLAMKLDNANKTTNQLFVYELPMVHCKGDTRPNHTRFCSWNLKKKKNGEQ